MRADVAARLAALSVPGGPLHTHSPESTAARYAFDTSRARFRRDVIERFLALDSPVVEQMSAIVTAGPPGAGKTSTLHAVVEDLDAYRILDADVIKDFLIEQALTDGIYDSLLTRTLPDGFGIAPRELAPLVHDESVKLIEQIRRICLEHRENVVVEATLQWNGHGPAIFGELAAADYTSMQILAVDAPRVRAHDQAAHRWWVDRQSWTLGNPPRMGGRFVPPAAIDACFGSSGESICTAHAHALLDRARDGEIARVRLRVFRRGPDGGIVSRFDESAPASDT